MARADQPDEQTRRIAWANAPAWAAEAGWDNPDSAPAPGHAFQPYMWNPSECGYVDAADMMCGYSQAEHTPPTAEPCADCGEPFGEEGLSRPFMWTTGPLAGRVVHRSCAAEAVNAWGEYQAAPWWKRAIVRLVMWVRHA